jgi:threonine dehydratase
MTPGDVVVAASTGNHGLAVATAGQQFGLEVVIHVPSNIPAIKRDGIARTGARVVAEHRDYDAAASAARRDVQRLGGRFISGFDDPEIIAGHRSMFAEVEHQWGSVDVVVVPVGGGGLIAAALGHYGESTRVVGVEWRDAPAMRMSLEAGRRVTLPVIRDAPVEGLLIRRVGAAPFRVCSKRAPQIELVDETQIEQAMRSLWRHHEIRAEGAAAAALAGTLALDVAAGTVLCIISGGNVDEKHFAQVLADC